MASGFVSRVEEQPPALPVKKQRSQFRGSSEGSDSFKISPVGLQHQNSTYNDVFPETTDCHAALCPIHQRYDHSLHQQRFFSDETPPPVPKKKLARTLSLPCGNKPLSPLSLPPTPQIHPQNFDNPLYMLAPISDTYLHEEIEGFEPIRSSSDPLESLSQLCFDTPDEHLPYVFSSFDDQKVVSQGIQHRHLLFLRSMAQSVESGILLQADASGWDISSYQPQDFLLCEGSEPKQIGDTVYYSLQSPKFPGRVLALRLHKQTDEAPSARTKEQPSHVNVQNVIAYFHPSNTLKDNSDNSLQTEDPSRPSKSDYAAAKPPGGGIPECPININLLTIQSLLQQGHCVIVERDLPHITLEDFVQESSSMQSTECAVYDRQVCVLLLQILLGSQHLCHLSAAADLRPREIFLVWPNKDSDEKTEREYEAERSDRLKEGIELEKMEKKGRIQMLWRTQGSPRVVLTPLSSSAPSELHLTSIYSKIGSLIQYCWGQQESLTSPAQSKSPYRRGLSYLASLFQDESSWPKMAEMVTMLQVLIWGPRLPLSNQWSSTTNAVHNWLTIKRALLVMKLAERGLIQDQSALDWEDCVCLQYLSFTDPETVVSMNSQLSLTLNVD